MGVSPDGRDGAPWVHRTPPAGKDSYMTLAATLDIVPLQSAVSAPVLGPADPGWDGARQAWNLRADQQPDAIAFANTPGDVRAIVDFARERGLKVAAQGTGHAATCLGSLAGTILLKTMRMGGVEVDPAGQTARVEAGALLGELAVAAGEHRLAGLSGS